MSLALRSDAFMVVDSWSGWKSTQVKPCSSDDDGGKLVAARIADSVGKHRSSAAGGKLMNPDFLLLSIRNGTTQ
jgi:hypothetical protein